MARAGWRSRASDAGSTIVASWMTDIVQRAAPALIQEGCETFTCCLEAAIDRYWDDDPEKMLDVEDVSLLARNDDLRLEVDDENLGDWAGVKF